MSWPAGSAAAFTPAKPRSTSLAGRIRRKNHYGSKSLRGTEVAALFYSLIETARLRGEDPGRYLLRAALAAIETPGTVTLPSSSD
ncbi:hypothetical protein ACN28E_18900 [Archangium lansingense]|uniref:hypothetical protein n=1 Tax=Archangium lansingense TaxID=2995310 RepID=UPI003B80AC78